MTRRVVSFAWPVLGVLAVVLVELHLRIPGQHITRVRGHVTHVSGVPLGTELRRRLAVGVLVTLLVLVLPALAQLNARRWRGRPTRPQLTLLDAPWHRDPVLWVSVLFAGTFALSLTQTHLLVVSSRASIGHPFTESILVMSGGPGPVGVLVLAAIFWFGSAAVMSAGRSLYRRLGDPSWRGSRKAHTVSAAPAQPPH